MQIIPRRELPCQFQHAGLDPTTREFPDPGLCHQITVRERNPLPFTGGPHRKVVYSDGRIEGPLPVADRPELGRFLAAVFQELHVEYALAAVVDGTFWLNNKAQATYLHKVLDAQRVSLVLRRRGLTDRFQGGFRLRHDAFASTIPLLAANTYAGGSDVLFAALSPASVRISALACHHFDIHFTTPDKALIPLITDLAHRHELDSETLLLPDLPELSELWSDA